MHVRLFVVGMNHTTASVAMRQRLSFDAEAIPRALRRLGERYADAERAIVSTCNRVEVYVAAPAGSPCDAAAVRAFLERFHRIPAAQFERQLYSHDGPDAARHLFTVSAGLDSMVLGESDILAQVKHSYLVAFENGATGPVLNTLFQMAFHLAKHVHAETALGAGRASVARRAVELLAREASAAAAKRVLIVGAGQVAAQVLEGLRQHGADRLRVANRDPQRGRQLADRFGGRACDLADLPAQLEWADVVLTATASTRPLVTADALRAVLAARGERPLCILDLGVPRNVDPAVAALAGVRLWDIDALRATAAGDGGPVAEARAAAERLIDEHVAQFADWFAARGMGPVLAELTRRFEAYADAQLAWLAPKLQGATDADRRRIAQMVHRLTHQVLHHPLKQLKDEALADRGEDAAQLLRKLFGLNGPENGETGEMKTTDKHR
jgi:glutamyl-tRNA reductase